jgi:hypothetical protein
MAQGKTLGRKPVGPRTEAPVRELRGKGFAILEADAGGAQPMPNRGAAVERIVDEERHIVARVLKRGSEFEEIRRRVGCSRVC